MKFHFRILFILLLFGQLKLAGQYFNVEKYIIEHLPNLKKDLKAAREIGSYELMSDSTLLVKILVPPIDSANSEDWTQYYLSRSLSEYFGAKYRMALEYAIMAHRRAVKGGLNRYAELALLEQASIFYNLKFYKDVLSLEQNKVGGGGTNYQLLYMLMHSALHSRQYDKCSQLGEKIIATAGLGSYDIIQVLKVSAEAKEKKGDYVAALEIMQRAEKLNLRLQEAKYENSIFPQLFYRHISPGNFPVKMRVEYVTIKNKMGALMLKNNDYQKAEETFTNVLAFVKEKDLNEYELQIEKSLGQTYTLLKQYDRGAEHYFKAEGLCDRENDKQQKAEILCLRAKDQFLLKNLTKAIELCKASIEIASVTDNFSQLTQSYEVLAEIHAFQGDIQKTIYYSDLAQENAEHLKNNVFLSEPERVGLNMKEEASYDVLAREKSELERKQLVMEARQHSQELQIMKNENMIKEANLRAQKLESQRAQQELTSIRQELESKKRTNELTELKKDKIITDILNKSNQTKIRLLNQQRRLDSEIKTQKERDVRDALNKEKNLRLILFVALIILGVIVFLLYRNVKSGKIIRLSNQKLHETLVEVNQKNEIINQKNHEILDSINYAERIQSASLQSAQDLSKLRGESFVLFKPKDIIGGDFYMISEPDETDGHALSAYIVGDCTGHGVPGAMLSLLCSNLVRESVKQSKTLSPVELLGDVNNKLKNFFRSTPEESFKDGMDIGCCVIDRKKNKLYFAGAGRPMFYVEDGVLTELKGERYHIGFSNEMYNFTNQELDVKPGGIIYLFSDGYTDQFSQKSSKRFMTQNLKKQLIEIHRENMAKQGQILDRVFEDWREGTRQTDDVCILGIKV